MNREIKFRLRIDNKIVGFEKWYEGETMTAEKRTGAEPQWLYSKDNEFWSPEYIYHDQKDQFTGLTDKNGKEIYEGDIVEHYCDKERKAECCHSIYQIVWEESGFTIPGCSFILDQRDWGNRFEVIGNIYENPELLKS